MTVMAFVVLAGGTAYAATHLGKNSVGTKQLKVNAVTTAKIKKNAVTTAKIKAGAIDTTKVADGSLTEADLDLASLPFGHIVFRSQGGGTAKATGFSELGQIPLGSPVYTQEAGQDNLFYGAVDVTFSKDCEKPRQAVVFALLDAGDPSKIPELEEHLVAGGIHSDEEEGGGTFRVDLSTIESGFRIGPAVATKHTLSMVVIGGCKTGTTTVSNPEIEVIGVK